MAYAVVHFIEDNQYSEVPTSWLTEDRKKCFWPLTNKNISTLINKKVPPDTTTWTSYTIEVIHFSDSLENARKRAQDSDYSSQTDDISEVKKRKPRKKLKKILEDMSESDENENDNSILPPALQSSTTQISYITTAPEADAESTEQNSEKNEQTLTDLANIPLVYVPNSSNELASTPTTSYVSNSSYSFPLETPINDCKPDIDKLLRLCSGIHEYVKSIDNRLKRLENKTNEEQITNIEVITQKIPIKCLNDLYQLEEILKVDDTKSIFIQYIKTVGGRHSKDVTHRILRRMYTDEFATKCSWLGQRNNIRVCDFINISIIKDSITSAHNITHHEFENFASEWFRLAGTRLTRKKI